MLSECVGSTEVHYLVQRLALGRQEVVSETVKSGNSFGYVQAGFQLSSFVSPLGLLLNKQRNQQPNKSQVKDPI